MSVTNFVTETGKSYIFLESIANKNLDDPKQSILYYTEPQDNVTKLIQPSLMQPTETSDKQTIHTEETEFYPFGATQIYQQSLIFETINPDSELKQLLIQWGVEELYPKCLGK